jgi:hypothetical protein
LLIAEGRSAVTTSGESELAVSEALEGWCTECGNTTFEHPPCPDGHGDECPELVCASCGLAYYIGYEPQLPDESGTTDTPAQAA